MLEAETNKIRDAGARSLGPFDRLQELDDLSLGFAYQPIVEGLDARLIGYEVLVRDVSGQPAKSVLSRMRPENREGFDQVARLRAIRAASRLGIDQPLHLNCSWLSPENVPAALARLALLRPDMVKLDRAIVSGVHRSRSRQAIVSGVLSACSAMGAQVIALGVEVEAELAWLSAQGINHFQGTYFAAPLMGRYPRRLFNSSSTASSELLLAVSSTSK